MSPEELAEARHYAACYQVGYVHSLMHSPLDHIDQQAARIAALEAQVAGLREIAVDECAASMSENGSPNGPLRRLARRQLTEEHPEAFQ